MLRTAQNPVYVKFGAPAFPEGGVVTNPPSRKNAQARLRCPTDRERCQKRGTGQGLRAARDPVGSYWRGATRTLHRRLLHPSTEDVLGYRESHRNTIDLYDHLPQAII